MSVLAVCSVGCSVDLNVYDLFRRVTSSASDVKNMLIRPYTPAAVVKILPIWERRAN